MSARSPNSSFRRSRSQLAPSAILLSASLSARFFPSVNPASTMVGTSARPASFAARSRPCPAMMTPCSSIRIGLVKPNSLIEALICSSCRLGCVRALRGSGLRLPTVRYSTARASEPAAVSVMNPSDFLLAYPGHSSGGELAAPSFAERHCSPTPNASNFASHGPFFEKNPRRTKREYTTD